MASGGEGQQDTKFKGQVSASIRDSIDKATGVLSQLHRIQSYLDVLRSISPGRAGDDGGVKSALEQIRSIRTDTAALLQTVYLTEISLLSMLEVGGGGAGLSALMPLFGDSAAIGSGGGGGAVAGEGEAGGGVSSVGAAGAERVVVEIGDDMNFTTEEPLPPPTKKL